MNSAFASVRANIVQKGPNLSHVDKVRRLYRHSLKLMGSWVVDRDIFCDEAEVREKGRGGERRGVLRSWI